MNKWYLISGCLLFFLSCKKDSDNQTDPAMQRVKTVTNNGFVTNYTYDAARKIIKSEAEIGFFKDEFAYSGATITRVISEPSNTATIIYELDGNGYVKSSKFSNASTSTFFEYSDTGERLRSYTDDNPVFEMRYYYNASSGLLDSARAMSGNIWRYTNLFSFFTDKMNTIGDGNFGQAFNGKLSPHPVKSIVSRKADGNIIVVSFTNYTYTYDSKDRVASRSFITSGGQTGTETYTYY